MMTWDTEPGTELLKEHCICCGAELVFEQNLTMIKCKFCGNTIETAGFQNELIHMKEALAQEEQIKHDLDAVLLEKEEAQERLNAAFSDLETIRQEQVSEEGRFSDIAKNLEQDRRRQDALLNLARAIQREDDHEESVLRNLLQTMTAGQNSASDKIAVLQELSSAMLKAQLEDEDKGAQIGNVINKIYSLQIDQQEKGKLALDFMSWMQSRNEEEISQLKQIQASADTILGEQSKLDEKLDLLQKKALQTQAILKKSYSLLKKEQLEELQRLYYQAEQEQLDHDFERAEEDYKKVIRKNRGDAEIYWRLLLCHYCVEYQVNEFGEYIPTIMNPDLTPPEEMSLRRDFLRQISDASRVSEEQRKDYEEKLAVIDRILDRYREIYQENAYDIFISFRQGAFDCPTPDSRIAADVYDFLSSKDYKVFFSGNLTLPAGESFEPYIIAALKSAKTLIVVGTCQENMAAQWVRNEWSRFQWLQHKEIKKEGKTERRLLCYVADGMQLEDLPTGLNPDDELITDGFMAHDRLLKIIGEKRESAINPSAQTLTSYMKPAEDEEIVVRQMSHWLLNGEFDKVSQKYDSLLEDGMFLERGKIHLYALCAQKGVRSEEELISPDIDLGKEELFLIAQELSSSEEESRQLADLKKRSDALREDAAEVIPEDSKEEIPVFMTGASQEQKETILASEWYQKAIRAKENNDNEEAFICYQKAAESGRIEAQRYVGWALYNGIGTEKDDTAAVYWYEKAANAGDPASQDWMGWFCESGTGTEKNPGKAFFWYEKAARQGFTSAQKNLANCYYNGTGTAKDMEQAALYYRKAAEAGAANCQRSLGYLLMEGIGVRKDPGEAVYWFTQAAKGGDVHGQRWLGWCYSNGAGVAADDSQAILWYREAAENGDKLSQRNVGVFYHNGRGVPKDDAEAAVWYEKAAAQGDSVAQFSLGTFYETGTGVRKDPVQAVQLYQKAALQNYSDAQAYLGVCYLNGTGIAKNYTEGVNWIKKSAWQGNRIGEFWLGWCYEKGYGVSKDYNQAFLWYSKSAEKEFIPAMRTMGNCYNYGVLAGKDSAKATFWYQKAAEQGDKEAAEALRKMKRFRLFR